MTNETKQTELAEQQLEVADRDGSVVEEGGGGENIYSRFSNASPEAKAAMLARVAKLAAAYDTARATVAFSKSIQEECRDALVAAMRTMRLRAASTDDFRVLLHCDMRTVTDTDKVKALLGDKIKRCQHEEKVTRIEVQRNRAAEMRRAATKVGKAAGAMR